MLAGLAQPTAGEITVSENRTIEEYRQKMSFMMEAPYLYHGMTAITVTLLTFIYFCLFSVPLTGKVVLQLLFIFLIMLHWCCAAVFYIMIMRSGILYMNKKRDFA